MPKVVIVGNDMYMAQMFVNAGWEIAEHAVDADLIQFTGGSDVSPALYDEASHPRTHSSSDRDLREEKIFSKARELDIPMAGICRGGQFLNVMSGGKTYQHVDNHAMAGSHQAIDVNTGDVIQVTSTHHQMMRVGERGHLLLAAFNQSTDKQHMVGDEIERVTNDKCDVEAAYYPWSKCLCFQPHPEYNHAYKECTDKYFALIEQCLGLKA